jgi:hypothetical protein
MKIGAQYAASCTPFPGGEGACSSQEYQWKAIRMFPCFQDDGDVDKKSEKMPLKERAILSWLCHILKKSEYVCICVCVSHTCVFRGKSQYCPGNVRACVY